MLEVPEGVVYNRVSDSDICFNLQESLSPVFDHLTSISLLDRCEIVFKDRLGGSRDIHIDLTLRGMKYLKFLKLILKRLLCYENESGSNLKLAQDLTELHCSYSDFIDKRG